MPAWVRNNALSIVLFGLFAIFLIGQSLTGWRTYNSDQQEHGEQTVGYGSYLTTGHFVEATFENWESEFLQMGAYVVLTVWLVQKGSSESKPPTGDPQQDADPRTQRDDDDAPGPARTGGWRLTLYENSLGIAFAVLFLMSMTLHALGGAREFSAEQVARRVAGERRAVRDDVGVLVPVLPELAERVRRGGHDRRALDLPPPEGFTRVEAGGRAPRADRQLSEGRVWARSDG